MNEGIVIALIETLMVKLISVSSGVLALQAFLPITQKLEIVTSSKKKIIKNNLDNIQRFGDQLI